MPPTSSADQEAPRPPQGTDSAAAEQLARQQIEQQPQQPAAWRHLGEVLERRGKLSEAIAAYERVAELDGRDVACRTALGHLLRRMSYPEEAIHWHAAALALHPDALILQLNHLCVLPLVPTSRSQSERLRQRCLEGLEGLEHLQRRGQRWEFSSHETPDHLFYLIYHHRDNRRALTTYGRLIQTFAQSRCDPQLLSPAASPPPRKGRRRIGFISGFFYNHSNNLAFEGLIRGLDRSRFEVVVIHLHSTPIDAVSTRLHRSSDQYFILSGDTNQALHQLRDLHLDLLFFTDIGMHPLITMLASVRSAPIQVTGWGVPQTSGLATVDHYISGSLVEPSDADSQYSENLVRLPGLPCCYLSENLAQTSRSRDFFFLPTDAPLLGCLQTFWKLHPDFDAMLEAIAQRLTQAWFVMVESEITSHTAILLERLAAAAPTFCERLILLSRQPRQEFMALAGCLDLLLDPPYFSSGISLYDTIHTGTPTVSLEGRFLRSRFVAGAYRLMELPDAPVAHSQEEYIHLVVALIEDRERLQRLRQNIRDRAGRLYDRSDVVNAFADFAWEATATAATAD